MSEWTHRIVLNAVDITALTTLGAMIDETENASHVADITYYPASGTQDPDGLKLQTLVIDADVGAGWATLFSGRIIRDEWDQKTRSYRLRASNRIQEYFRALASPAAVLAAITGSVYSEAMFGEAPDDLWEYAQRCMETVEADVHIDRAGALDQVPWEAAVSADHALTAADIHNNGAFSLISPDADEMINEVTIVYEYRVRRWKVRTHTLSWSAWNNNVGINSWCEWAIGPKTTHQFPLPMLPLLEQVFLGGSWSVPNGVAYDTHPKTAANLCGVSGWVWVNNEPEDGEIACTTGAATGYRSFEQPIFETYTLTVTASAAQTLYGATVSDAKSGSLDVPADPAWNTTTPAPQPTWFTDAIGDSYQDQADETSRANDLQAGYQWASARIRGGLRATSLTVHTDLRPDITLADTVSVDSYGLSAKGKVRRIRTVLDAAPRTELTLAISRGNGGTTDSWSVPARPDTTDPGYAAPDSSDSYGTYAGGWSGADAAPDPDQRTGWITNVIGTAADGTNEYSPAFRGEWPEIEDDAAAERNEDVPSGWEVAVPHDTLILA